MRILLVHNYYQQAGGEDRVAEEESALLASHGHEVERFDMHNEQIEGMGRMELALATLWNRDACTKLRTTMRRHRPQVVHFHNTFPLISPAAYYTAADQGAAVVQTLHNYRLLCPNALLMRDGRPCEDCLGKAVAWPAVTHGCYRGSRAASLTTAAMLGFHRLLRTWAQRVDLYIVLTEFARRKFIEGGLPAQHIVVKPHFVECSMQPGGGVGGYGLYVGRLSAEKGVAMLLDAWQKLDAPVELRIVGDGPLAPLVQRACAADPRIRWLGHRPPEDVLRLLGDARFLIVPSICYETFGRAAVEAFSRGTPVIAANHGALAELIDDGRTGLLFRPADKVDLAAKVLDWSRRELAPMRQAARDEWKSKYTPEANYSLLMAAYARAMLRRESRGRQPPFHSGAIGSPSPAAPRIGQMTKPDHRSAA